MATYRFFDVGTMQEIRMTPTTRTALLLLVEKAEKKNFPANEALDFNAELKKRNTELLVYLGDGSILVAYAVFNRLGKVTLFHKILVLEQYRRQGIAHKMLNGHLERLRRQGCTHVQLWVDETREPAREVYQSLGFEEVDRIKDYYSSGRTGIKMKLSLSI